MKKTYTISIIIISTIITIWGIDKLSQIGFEDETDIVWLQVDSLIENSNLFYHKDKSQVTDSISLLTDSTIFYLQDKPAYLDSIYNTIQKDTNLQTSCNDTFVMKIISKPFPPTQHYLKFAGAVELFYRNQFVMVSGVNGSGKSTLVDRVTKVITADKEKNVLKLTCVPERGTDYHKEYIGEYRNGIFQKGKLLNFWEKAWEDSLHNYVMIIDDIDKIYPATLFGADVWGYMDNPKNSNIIEGYYFDNIRKKKKNNQIEIPDNFILISVTSTVKSNVINIIEELGRRLGKLKFFMFPDVTEFYMYLITKIKKKRKKDPLFNENTEKQHLHKLLYFFIKANKITENKYGKNYTVGQWSSIKKKRNPEEFNAFVSNYIAQVNELDPELELKREHLANIFYTINNNGKLEDTNFFARILNLLLSTGLFSEFFGGLLFLTVSGIIGLFIYNSRKKHIYLAIADVNTIFENYKSNKISYSEAEIQIKKLRKRINELVAKKKVNYMEATYFFNLVNNRMSDKSHIINDFFVLIEHFVEDKIIDYKEYLQLQDYLDKIKGKIPNNQYQLLKIKVEELYKKSTNKIANKKNEKI